jgi:hypothetical protein
MWSIHRERSFFRCLIRDAVAQTKIFRLMLPVRHTKVQLGNAYVEGNGDGPCVRRSTSDPRCFRNCQQLSIARSILYLFAPSYLHLGLSVGWLLILGLSKCILVIYPLSILWILICADSPSKGKRQHRSRANVRSGR